MAYQGNNNNRNNQNYKGGGNKNFPPRQQVELPDLVLDYKKDPALFDTTASTWAKLIDRTKKTQARNFYEKVLELEAKSQNEAWENVLPFVKMLNSKVAYGVSRKVVSFEFEKMMNRAIMQINTPEDLRVFKLFFEAVLGFFKGSN
jgi:CRISPR-associated protein Csm2